VGPRAQQCAGVCTWWEPSPSYMHAPPHAHKQHTSAPSIWASNLKHKPTFILCLCACGHVQSIPHCTDVPRECLTLMLGTVAMESNDMELRDIDLLPDTVLDVTVGEAGAAVGSSDGAGGGANTAGQDPDSHSPSTGVEDLGADGVWTEPGVCTWVSVPYTGCFGSSWPTMLASLRWFAPAVAPQMTLSSWSWSGKPARSVHTNGVTVAALPVGGRA
jgi:hypothetical protein